MRLFDRLKGLKKTSGVKMVVTTNDRFYKWNGKIYSSDIVRACIAPKVKTIGKLLATHIRTKVLPDGKKDTKVNPEPYMRFLLEEPNPYMTGQKLQERMAAQLAINKNAFALIVRDENGYPTGIYPIACTGAEALYDSAGTLFLRFSMPNGESYTFDYSDVIHLTEDVAMGTIFGQPIMPALAPLMEIVTTTDQGIISAIKNSSVIRWLLKFNTSQRPEDIKQAAEDFANSFLSIENGTGVAGVDAKAEATQIEPHDFIPNAAQMEKTKFRIYALFNTNEKIVHSNWTESEWAAYFEAEIEPDLLDMQNEYTRKLFSRRERAAGNRIIFDAGGIDSETTSTKLSYVQMVNRRSMTPNEWREKFHMAPIEGGDKPYDWQNPGNALKGGETE